MKITKNDVLKRLKDLKSEIKNKFNARELYLFGSFIRDEQNEKSDIDVLVEFDQNADLIDLIGLSNKLEDEFHVKVDVVPKNALRDEIRSAVLKSSIII